MNSPDCPEAISPNSSDILNVEDRATILELPPGSLIVSHENDAARVYIREDPVRYSRYPRHCAAQLRIMTWDCQPVLLAALLVRLGRSNVTTFHRWLNASDNADLRILQAFADQPRIDIELLTEGAARLFTISNTARVVCRDTLEQIRRRRTWTPEQFGMACAAVDRLYPTAHAAWWAHGDAHVLGKAARTMPRRRARSRIAPPSDPMQPSRERGIDF